MTLRQFRDMYQAFDPVLDPYKGTEGNQLGYLARHHLADSVSTREGLPRIFLSGFQGQRNPFAIHIHIQYLDGNFLTDFHHFGGVIDMLPGQFGYVHQAVYSAQVHEGTEVDDGRNHAGTNLTLLQGIQELGAYLRLGLLQPGTAGKHHVVAVLIQFNNLGFELATNIGSEVAYPAHLYQRSRQEAAQTDIQNQAALDHLDHGTGDHAIGFLDLLDVAPGTLVLGTLLRKQ